MKPGRYRPEYGLEVSILYLYKTGIVVWTLRLQGPWDLNLKTFS
jgi:hypothetical protein